MSGLSGAVAKTIIVARAEPGLLAHFPDVVRLRDGRLLAVYREGAGHVESAGRIRLTESADGGVTWTPPRTVADGPNDDRDPKIVELNDGTVLLSWFVLDWTTQPRYTNHGTYTSRSADGGRTWGEPRPVGVDRAVSHGAAVSLSSGDVLLPLYLRPAGEKWETALVVRSADGGRTWDRGDDHGGRGGDELPGADTDCDR